MPEGRYSTSALLNPIIPSFLPTFLLCYCSFKFKTSRLGSSRVFMDPPGSPISILYVICVKHNMIYSPKKPHKLTSVDFCLEMTDKRRLELFDLCRHCLLLVGAGIDLVLCCIANISQSFSLHLQSQFEIYFYFIPLLHVA